MTSLIKQFERLIEKIPVLGVIFMITNRATKRIMTENLSFLAGGVAFYSLLSAFPAMTALVSLYGLIAEIDDVQRQLSAVEPFFPADAYLILSEQLNAIATQSNTNLSIAMLIGLFVTFFSAARGIKAMLAAMNIVYNVRETRRWLRRNVLAYMFTVGAIASMAAAIFTIVAIPVLLHFLKLPEFIADQVALVRWLILGGGIWFGLALLFRYGPNRTPKHWFSMLIGAGVSTLLWILVSAAFSTFVELFPSFNDVYGSLSAIIVLMFWFYLTAYTILAGSAVNVVIEEYFDI